MESREFYFKVATIKSVKNATFQRLHQSYKYRKNSQWKTALKFRPLCCYDYIFDRLVFLVLLYIRFYSTCNLVWYIISTTNHGKVSGHIWFTRLNDRCIFFFGLSVCLSVHHSADVKLACNIWSYQIGYAYFWGQIFSDDIAFDHLPTSAV